MKRCTTCNRTFTDPNLRFCIDDGTPLTDVEPDDDATVVSPRNQDNSWNSAAYQPPRSYVPPGGERKRRRAWPWLVGLAGAFIVGVLLMAIAGTMLVKRIERHDNPQLSTRVPENSNTAPPETKTNTNTNTNVNAPAPTDQEQVLAQLKDIENDWTVANLNADKKKLDRILADDFVGEGPDQQPQTKAEYIQTIERDTGVEKWEFANLKVVLTGDRATLTGMITYFAGDRKVAYDFTDKFVWRDGRWQATGSVVKQLDNSGTDV